MNINFLTAADAFLYLPVYLADKCNIYEEIDNKLKIDVFSPLDSDNKCGDAVALNQLLENNKSGSDISIAVCDPFAMFDNSIKTDLSEFRILGSMISKVPFWAVNGPNNQESDESSLSSFDRVICYDQKFTTGNYIGMRTYEKVGIQHCDIVSFGNEFNILLSDTERKSVAVTCDVISMALLKDKVSVKHSYSKNEDYKNFISTALITTKAAYEDHPDILAKVLQGIQSALGIILTSKSIAISVCLQLVEKKERDFYTEYHKSLMSGQLDLKQIETIVDYIYKAGFYNENLQISQPQWNSTLDNYANNYKTPEKKNLCLTAKDLYKEIVVNKVLLEAQKRHLKAVRISLRQLSQGLIEENLAAQKDELLKEFEKEKVQLSNENVTLLQSFKEEKKGLIDQTRLQSILVTTSIAGGLLFLLSNIPYLGINGIGKLVGFITGLSFLFYFMLRKFSKKSSSKAIIITITCIIALIFVSVALTFKYLAFHEANQQDKELYDFMQNLCLGFAFGIPTIVSLLILLKTDEK